MKKGKIINEFYSVCTENDIIMCAEYEDGEICVEFEDHMINDNQFERTNNCNKDRNGNYYTTKKIITLSEYGKNDWKRTVEYHKNPNSQRQQAIAEHLIMLADSEKQRQNDGTYTNATEIFKANSIKRIQHYIDVRTPQEKALPEYNIFIQAMEKSIAMCKDV